MLNTKRMWTEDTNTQDQIPSLYTENSGAQLKITCSMTNHQSILERGCGDIEKTSRMSLESPYGHISEAYTADGLKLIETRYTKRNEEKEKSRKKSRTSAWSTKDPSISRAERESEIVKETSLFQARKVADICLSALTEEVEHLFWKRSFRYQSRQWKTRLAGLKKDSRNSKPWPLTMTYCSSITRKWNRNSKWRYISVTNTLLGKRDLWRTGTKSLEDTFLKALTFQNTHENSFKNLKVNCKDKSWNV